MQKAFEKIIERLEEYPTYSFGVSLLNTEEYIKVSDLVEIVNQVASEYGGGWIPVSSGKLPKIYEPVLVCNREGRVFVRCINWISRGREKIPRWSQCSSGIIAWQPLPPVYKAKSEE